MNTRLEEAEGRLKIRIEANELTERRFLRQLMERGASVILDDVEYWTVITIVGNSPVDAELSELNEMLS